MKKLKYLFAFVIAIALSLLPVFPIAAQSSAPFYWDFINVDLEVKDNGDMLVTETQQYVFTASHTKQRYRYIPLDKVNKITDISVSENGNEIPIKTGIKNNQQWIQWQHELNPPETHTFVLKYRVIGGLHVNSQETQVYWKAIFADRKAPINKSTVTVRFPAALANRISNYRSFGVPADARSIDATTIQFAAKQALPPQTELEIKIAFPVGILQVERAYSARSRTSIDATSNYSNNLEDRQFISFQSKTLWIGMLGLHSVAFGALIFLYKRSKWIDRTVVSKNLPNLNLYEIAYLVGGEERVSDVAISNLMRANILHFSSDIGRFHAEHKNGLHLHNIEAAILEKAKTEIQSKYSLYSSIKHPVETLTIRLQELGAYPSNEQLGLYELSKWVFWILILSEFAFLFILKAHLFLYLFFQKC